ncbi:glycosyltransferase family 2 protein [Eubacterium limosum]|uniref:Glycosyltransferase family 2 protein n=1 Tax=Eubacterium limosum TaxID=1736 RepID=A0ABT5UUQ0_EUBLI|nr:glycosyltransferase family 2 protein [Eubacterium limosum]MCB6571882.1 glycosyltransferase family 2 protein [Eubacterium limosum]MDE1472694.1 glycosyltransferase family 2 protein [Eubacterium limosum]
MKTMSIIVPCYNEEEAIPLFYNEISKIANLLKTKYKLITECIIVNDGSSDETLKTIKMLAQNDPILKYISFSRNFGKESAIYAGLEYSTGDFVAIMDVDLQDPPELLEEMYLSIINENFDCVATRRVTRKGEPPIRSFFARCFYKLINKMSKIEIVDGARDYRLMTRQMVDAIINVKEYNRFSKGIFSWVGFETKWLEYENRERIAGETKWSFWKLFLYSLDGIVAYTTAPLAIASIVGVLCCFIAIIMIGVFIIKTIIWGDPVAGYPSMICVILLIGGLQLFCIGILGEYLAKTYLETKKRPIYIMKEKSKNEKDK